MRSKVEGFTLIEVAILLVVIGLIVGGSLSIVNPIIDSGRASTTLKRMALVEKALQSYVEQFGCLPCPADGADASTVATAGSSEANGATYTTGCATAVCDVSANAVVPWRTLGISEDEATDGWGYRMRYDVADAGTPCAVNQLWGADGMVRCDTSSYPEGGITLTDNDGVFADVTDAAYVLLSNGPDKSLALAARTATASTDVYGQTGGGGQDENTDGDETYSYGTLNSTSGDTHFDDIVRYKTAPVMIQMCGPGLCGNPS